MRKVRLAVSKREQRRRWLFSIAPYIGVGLILLILPPFLSSYLQMILTKVLIFGIFAMSLDIVLGYTGLMSIGHGAMLGVAGYGAGILMIRYGIDSFWLVTPLAILMAAVLAAIFGYIALRASGIYFMLITIAFSQLMSVVADKWKNMTNGTDGLTGIPYPDLGIAGFTWTASNFYYLAFIIFVICYFLLYRISNSPFGRSLVGIRENEPRMASLGFNTWAHKFASFVLGGAFAGVAGALFAYFYGIMMPANLGAMMGAYALVMVFIGGAGTLFGPVIGAGVVVLLEHFASLFTPERWPLILGGVFMISVVLVRGGFAGYLSRFWGKLRVKYGTVEG